MEASPPKSDSSSTASSSNRIQNMISFFEKMSEQNQPKPSPSQRKGNSASWSKSESSTMTRGERMKRFQSLPMVKNAKRKREKERKEAPKSAEGEEKEKGKEEEMGDPKESVTKLLSGSHEISRSDVHEGIAARKVMFDRVDGTNQNEKEKKRSPREKPEDKEKEKQSHRASIPVENFSPFEILPREMALQVTLQIWGSRVNKMHQLTILHRYSAFWIGSLYVSLFAYLRAGTVLWHNPSNA